MNYLRSLIPAISPYTPLEKGEVFIWRERILHTLILILASLGLVMTFIMLSLSTNLQSKTPVYAAVFATALLISLFLGRQLPYGFRGIIVVLIFLFFAVAAFIAAGPAPYGYVMLIGFIIVTAILFGLRNAYYALAVSGVTALIFGVGMVNGFIPMPPADLIIGNNFTGWLSNTLMAGFVAMIAVTSIDLMMSGIQSGYDNQQQLVSTIEKDRQSLELNVFERTQNLQVRLNQIRTASEVSQTIVSVLDPNELYQRVVNIIQERFGLYYVGLFLLDEKGENAILRAGTGEEGKQMMEAGHFLPLGGSSMIGWATANQKARIALDVGKEAVRFNNPYLPWTHSEMALPIVSRSNVIGALSVQSHKENAFDENDVLILQGIADSIATAIENNRLFLQTQIDLEEISTLNRGYLKQSWDEVIAQGGELEFNYIDPTITSEQSTARHVEVPLSLRGQPIGRFNIELDRNSLNEEEQAFVDAIASQTALALENARLLELSQKRAAQEEKINSLTAEFTRYTSMDEIIKVAASQLSQLPLVSEVTVQLVAPEINLGDENPENNNHNGNGSEA